MTESAQPLLAILESIAHSAQNPPLLDQYYTGMQFEDSAHEFLHQSWYIERYQHVVALHCIRDDFESNPLVLTDGNSPFYVKPLINSKTGEIILRLQCEEGVIYLNLYHFVGILDNETIPGWQNVNEYDEQNQTLFHTLLSIGDDASSVTTVSEIYVFNSKTTVPRQLGFTNKVKEGRVLQ